MIAIHNLDAEPLTTTVTLDDCPPETKLLDLLGDDGTQLDQHRRAQLPLDGYGYSWLRVLAPGERRPV